MDGGNSSDVEKTDKEKYEIRALKERITQLERTITASNLQIVAEKKRYESFQEKLSKYVDEKLNLQKKLAEHEWNNHEMKKEIELLSTENRNLLETKSDMEMALAEGDIYQQFLKENMEKLENVCSTLRDQREDQIMYFKQKETCLQRDLEQKVDKIKQEKAAVVKSLTEMELENANLKDELEQLRVAERKWEDRKNNLEDAIANFRRQIKTLEKDLRLAKETARELSLKNSELTDASQLDKGTLSKETTSMIEDLVQKFYEKKRETASQFNEKRIAKLTKQLSETEAALSEERRARSETQVRLEATEGELRRSKADADSLFELSVARTRNNLNRTRLHKSNFSSPPELPSYLATPLEVSQLFKVASDSTLLLPDQTREQKASELSDNERAAVASVESVFTSVSTNDSV